MSNAQIDAPASMQSLLNPPSKKKERDHTECVETLNTSKKMRTRKVTFANADVVYTYEKAPKLKRDCITPLGADKDVDPDIIKQAKHRTTGFAKIISSERLCPKFVYINVSGCFLKSDQAKLKHMCSYYVVSVIHRTRIFCRSGTADEYGTFDFDATIEANVEDDVELRIYRESYDGRTLVASVSGRFD